MNKGQCYKLFYSSDPTVLRLIDQAISTWPLGFCKQINSLTNNQDENWVIEIEKQDDQKSVEAIIDAYMHIRCGISYFDLDRADMERWLSSSNRFRTITVQGKPKELAYELWNSVCKTIDIERQRGFDIETVLLTVSGKMLSLEEVNLYSSIIKSFGFNVIINTNLFKDNTINNEINLHLSLNKVTYSNSDIPEFLKH